MLLATFLYLYSHVTTARIDASRDAMMFGTTADTTRTLQLRTDFASFYYACKAASQGGNMYDANYLDSLAARDYVANHVLPYLYPPFFAVVAKPLASLFPTTAQQVWDFLAVALFCLVVRFVMLTPSDAAAPGTARSISMMETIVVGAFCYALVRLLPFTTNLDFGQINFLVLFFLAASFYVIFNNKSEILAGAFLSVAALIKVTPALFALFFLVKRKWKALNSFLLSSFALIGLSVLLGGGQPWQQFLAFLPDLGYAKNVSGGFHPSIPANISVAGFFLRLLPGEGPTIRFLTMSVLAILFGILVYKHLKYRNETNDYAMVLPYLLLMILASPVAWMHHLVFLFPGIVFTLRAIWVGKERRLRWVFLVLLMVFGAVYDFQPLYSKLEVAESLRPFVTSMNLVFLLTLFFAVLSASGSGSRGDKTFG